MPSPSPDTPPERPWNVVVSDECPPETIYVVSVYEDEKGDQQISAGRIENVTDA